MTAEPTFEAYADRFEHIRLDRRDGIVQLTLHTDGADIVWDRDTHREVGDCLTVVGRDPDTRVVIITGAGDSFIDRHRLGGDSMDAEDWNRLQQAGLRLVRNHLAVEVPLVAAVHGRATIHAELALLCDVVVASDTAVFADRPHFGNGLVPGDGAHIVWPLLLGPNRGRAFLFTDAEIGAVEAQRLGLVAEVLAPDLLLDRAWTLARRIAEQPALTTRFTRQVATRPLRRAIEEELELGLALEGLAATAYWPERFR